MTTTEIKVTSIAQASRVGGHEMPNRWWFTPAVFILVPPAMSFIAWTILVGLRAHGPKGVESWEKLIGFSEPTPVTWPGVALVLFWYAAVVLVATLGWRLGCGRKPHAHAHVAPRTRSPSFERRYFLFLLTVSFLGVGYTYYKLGGPSAILGSLATQSGNDFTNSLPGSAGLQTLRFATILAAPVGIYLWRKKVIRWPFAAAGLALLLLSALISSRLSLLMAAFVYLVISLKSRGQSARTRMSGKRLFTIVAITLAGFGVLTALNYFRNANYYRDAGVSNPAMMNVYQMGAYLDVPAQVSLGVANAIMHGTWDKPGDPVDSLKAIRPTFLQFEKVSKDMTTKEAADYDFSASFESNFTTNSVFADTYADYGVWGWFYAICLYGLAGYLMARLVQSSTVIAAAGGVVAYTFSEVWRVQILNYGIVIFLIVLSVGCAFVSASLDFRRRQTFTA